MLRARSATATALLAHLLVSNPVLQNVGLENRCYYYEVLFHKSFSRFSSALSIKIGHWSLIYGQAWESLREG